MLNRTQQMKEWESMAAKTTTVDRTTNKYDL